ncbi:MAG: GNAT family N-acetyltransferase [Rhodobacteraceae bacterium]|nr:GNAT family N-acetyltransferase [Paracoccaceae bacterium]MCP5340786.1 GNAT family N-acetyltransferase [Paracoccaceae bacterium]
MNRTHRLATRRLVLRRPRASDLAALHAIMSEARAMRYWATPAHGTMEETRAWLARTVAAARSGRSDEFIIERRGQVIGKAGAWRMPEIGFILGLPFWGHGYAHEAMCAVIGDLFARHPTDQLTADVDPRNAASQKLLGRLGFQETGRAKNTILWGDEWCDSAYYALDRKVWQARTPPPERLSGK